MTKPFPSSLDADPWCQIDIGGQMRLVGRSPDVLYHYMWPIYGSRASVFSLVDRQTIHPIHLSSSIPHSIDFYRHKTCPPAFTSLHAIFCTPQRLGIFRTGSSSDTTSAKGGRSFLERFGATPAEGFAVSPLTSCQRPDLPGHRRTINNCVRLQSPGRNLNDLRCADIHYQRREAICIVASRP